MRSSILISKITLNNFRSHQEFSLNSRSNNIVLYGENGAGKTNILESLSLLSPGRGLRNAKNEEIININHNTNYSLLTDVEFDESLVKIKKTFVKNSIQKSNFFMDDEKCKTSDLLNFLRVIWVTPIMEKIMLQSNSERRNFFDRLIFNINKKYLKSFSAYNKFTKERLHLLKSNIPDDSWLDQIEFNIAEKASEVIKYRNDAIIQINENLTLISKPFNSCTIELIYESSLKSSNHKEDFITNYKRILQTNRFIDKELNRTSMGPNKVQVNIWKLDDSSIEAKQCSTGEQKSILISIILSVAQIIVRSDFGKPPIILIDEAMAHLDQNHREALIDELGKLNTQSWFTGVSKEIFTHLNKDTIFFEVKNS